MISPTLYQDHREQIANPTVPVQIQLFLPAPSLPLTLPLFQSRSDTPPPSRFLIHPLSLSVLFPFHSGHRISIHPRIPHHPRRLRPRPRHHHYHHHPRIPRPRHHLPHHHRRQHHHHRRHHLQRHLPHRRHRLHRPHHHRHRRRHHDPQFPPRRRRRPHHHHLLILSHRRIPSPRRCPHLHHHHHRPSRALILWHPLIPSHPPIPSQIRIHPPYPTPSVVHRNGPRQTATVDANSPSDADPPHSPLC